VSYGGPNGDVRGRWLGPGGAVKTKSEASKGGGRRKFGSRRMEGSNRRGPPGKPGLLVRSDRGVSVMTSISASFTQRLKLR